MPSAFFLLYVIFIGTFFFYKGLFNFFLQDDFFFLKMTQVTGVLPVVDFFGFDRPYGFWRPLGKDLFFYLNQKLFGLNPFPYHLAAMLLYFANILLVYILAILITKSRKVAMLSAFFYALSASHFSAIYWIAPIENVIAAFFYFLSLIFYLRRSYIFAILSFVFCLASMELAVTLPFVIVAYELIVGRRFFKKAAVYFLILAIYFAARLLLGNFAPKVGIYAPTFDLFGIANSLRWYLAWAIGIPEMFLDFIGPGFAVNPNLFKFYRVETMAIATLFLTFMVTVFVYAVILLRKKSFLKNRVLLFAILFFSFAIGPVLILPWHRFPFYLSIAHFGIAMAIALIVDGAIKYSPRRIGYAMVVLPMLLFLFLNWTTINLTERTNPVVNRSRLALKTLRDLKTEYPVISASETVYFVNDPESVYISGDWGFSSKQASVALAGENAVQAFWHNHTIKVYFEDTGIPPSGIGQVLKVIAPAKY